MRRRVWGWEFFQALERNCKTENGYGAFSDVQGKGHLLDQTESFLGAETLKYLFLLFSSKVHVDLSKEFFSTEGHILPIRSLVCSDSSYQVHLFHNEVQWRRRIQEYRRESIRIAFRFDVTVTFGSFI